MRFGEAVRVALGMKNKGVQPTGLLLKKIAIGGPLKVEWDVATDITSDELLISQVVTELFRAPRVMSFPFERESVAGSLASINQVHDTLQNHILRFHGANAQKDKFYAQLLVEWQLACRRAAQQLEDAQRQEEEDREAYQRGELIQSSDITRAADRLPEVLFDFRQCSYPWISAFIDLLPPDHPTRVEAELMLLEARKMLMNYRSASSDSIVVLEWDVDI